MMSSRVGGSVIMVRQLGQRIFSTSLSASAVSGAQLDALFFGSGSSSATPAAIARFLPVRMASTSAAPASVGGEDDGSSKGQASAAANPFSSNQLTSYWGVAPRKLFKEDGSEWRWSCFRPWDTYMSDTTIDLNKHHAPTVFLDKIAYWTVKLLRVPTDIFFQRRYGCRAMMLETVAAVPGMVGGMLLHLRSLRRFEHSGGWVRALLEEAENERMHLMTFMEVTQPRWYERALVIAVQGIFFNAYFAGYLISPKFAHRVVGYLEEEAIHSYTEFLRDLDNGNIENVPAPEIAKDYWRLPPDATLRDVVIVVRADEAHHRDVNHFASGIKALNYGATAQFMKQSYLVMPTLRIGYGGIHIGEYLGRSLSGYGTEAGSGSSRLSLNL